MIYMYCPDFVKKSGGTKRVYHVVNTLIENGFDACVMHSKHGFYLHWTGIQVPVIYLDDMKADIFKKEDIVIDFTIMYHCTVTDGNIITDYSSFIRSRMDYTVIFNTSS